MKKIIYFITCSFMWTGAFAQVPFSEEITPVFNSSSLKLDCKIFAGDYSSKTDFVDVLAISSDCTAYDIKTNKFAPIKGNISNVYAIQDGTLGAKADSMATVFATIEKNAANNVLGNGGGTILFKIKRDKTTKAWTVVSMGDTNKRKIFFKNVDFSEVGGTINNKGFAYVGTVDNITHRFLVTEDITSIRSNKDLSVITMADTADYVYPDAVTKATLDRSVIPAGKSVKKYLTQGWPVEIDGRTGEVIGKVHRMGRGVTSIIKAQSVFYLAYGGNPSVLLRYAPFEDLDKTRKVDFPAGEPDVGGDGQVYLYAYKQNADGTGGFTIPVAAKIDSVANPNDPTIKIGKFEQIFDSLIIAKDVALRAGATMFANIGDLAATKDDNGSLILLITEKGIDDSGDNYSSYSKKFNGVLANHLKALDATTAPVDNKFKDPYGRILSLSESGALNIFTEGGVSRGNLFFSNPDKLEVTTFSMTTLITVKENIPAATLGRNPSSVDNNAKVNEAYFIEKETGPVGIFPLDVDGKVVPVPFDDYKIYQSGSTGSQLSASGGLLSPYSGTFLSNSNMTNFEGYDTYLSVVNGYNGTDKSMILAVRNIFPEQSQCLPAIVSSTEKFTTPSGKPAFWPNPSKGVLHASEVSDYIVTDLSGKQVKSVTGSDSIDMSDLGKGIFFVKNIQGFVYKIVLE